MIINPAATTRDVTALPWINFEITDMREDDEWKGSGSRPLLFTLVMRAGPTELRYEKRRTDQMMGS
jgi:hypothetical protein